MWSGPHSDPGETFLTYEHARTNFCKLLACHRQSVSKLSGGLGLACWGVATVLVLWRRCPHGGGFGRHVLSSRPFKELCGCVEARVQGRACSQRRCPTSDRPSSRDRDCRPSRSVGRRPGDYSHPKRQFQRAAGADFWGETDEISHFSLKNRLRRALTPPHQWHASSRPRCWRNGAALRYGLHR